MTDRLTPEQVLAEALRSALTVVLHEALDPKCEGEPPYDETAAMAARVMQMPNVTAALRAKGYTLTAEAGLREALEEWDTQPDTKSPTAGAIIAIGIAGKMADAIRAALALHSDEAKGFAHLRGESDG
jgi:hypothetical protein